MDKQGILSWPNPSPETVLFFSGRVEPPHNSQDDLRDDLSVNSYYRMETDDDRNEVCLCDVFNRNSLPISGNTGIDHWIVVSVVSTPDKDAIGEDTVLDVEDKSDEGQDYIKIPIHYQYCLNTTQNFHVCSSQNSI